MTVTLLVSMLIMFVLTVPIALAIGGASTLAITTSGDLPLLVVVQRIFTSLDSFPLMAIPFFILAGSLMESGGISKRLVHFANTLVGSMTGGLAGVTVVTSMFFAAISGSSPATVAAIGSIMIPAMVAKHYDVNFAAAVQSVAGALGVIIPPSIPMILYGVVVGVSIGDLFLAGIVPGFLIGGSLVLTAFIISKRKGYKGTQSYTGEERLKAFLDAIFAMLMPVIILGGIYGGIFTPTEAAVVAVAYALIIGTVVYREITFKNIIPIFVKSGITTAIIMLIIGNAGLLGWILTKERIPQTVAQSFIEFSDSPIVFLLIVNLFLLIVGMFFETSASVIILAPILAPIAMQLGINPIHFGIIMVVNLAIGMVTPPLGVNLFVAMQISKVKLEQLSKAVLIFLAVLIFDVLLISYVPEISMFLVEMFEK
ncbi:TRAP transporter large permease [Pontibacillus marinus]|uniref:C4-dicarboxylate ABC transporter permease n=1 Tax=Pontibacillus marinus BH030004 = DSM 16465 TaxID=1385511 RepID=A0A0A5GKK4_9BACI|nr:TRAP transporter large permease [Pontibacillus marinus]KGX91763.1 C4-dicarboxylate ABC transporter permease [Pontibacillus marinus BH030004 = DSM 16465]